MLVAIMLFSVVLMVIWMMLLVSVLFVMLRVMVAATLLVVLVVLLVLFDFSSTNLVPCGRSLSLAISINDWERIIVFVLFGLWLGRHSIRFLHGRLATSTLN